MSTTGANLIQKKVRIGVVLSNPATSPIFVVSRNIELEFLAHESSNSFALA